MNAWLTERMHGIMKEYHVLKCIEWMNEQITNWINTNEWMNVLILSLNVYFILEWGICAMIRHETI